MKTMLKGGRVWRADATFESDCPVIWEDGVILAVGDACNGISVDHTLDVTGKMLLPGLVDVHTHGRAGCDFDTASADEMRMMKADYARHGVTTVFATLASASVADWMRSINAIEVCSFDGIHLEGRYLNPAKKGAHAPEMIVPLDAAELETFLSAIHIPCHISAAFELDRDGSFAACARKYGATMGLAHTMATAEEARLAVSRGVTSFTHLYNAMPPLHHREGGAVSVALCGGGYGELIVDGMHVCAEMVKLAYRCLGEEKTVLITDSMQGTGCPDGSYTLSGLPVIVKNGKALTLDGVLAGSTLDLWDGVKNLMNFAGISLEKAIACATVNPARMVGIDDRVGSIDAGKRADLLVVDADTMELCSVYASGEKIR